MALSLTIATPLPEGISTEDLSLALDATEIAADVTAAGQISLALVDEKTTQQLNKQYAGNDYATDVLSFNYFEDEAEEPSQEDTLGEVIICLPIAQKQAEEHDQTLRSEIMLLFVHGLMHIFGFDHQSPDDQASFETAQGAILSKLKINARNIFDGNSR